MECILLNVLSFMEYLWWCGEVFYVETETEIRTTLKANLVTGAVQKYQKALSLGIFLFAAPAEKQDTLIDLWTDLYSSCSVGFWSDTRFPFRFGSLLRLPSPLLTIVNLKIGDRSNTGNMTQRNTCRTWIKTIMITKTIYELIAF